MSKEKEFKFKKGDICIWVTPDFGDWNDKKKGSIRTLKLELIVVLIKICQKKVII